MAERMQTDRGDAARWIAIGLPVATLIWGASQFIIQRADAAQRERIALVSALSPKLVSSNIEERNAAALTVSILLNDAKARGDSALVTTLEALNIAYEPLIRSSVASADPQQLEEIAKTREARASIDTAPRPLPEAEQDYAEPAVAVLEADPTEAGVIQPDAAALASVSLVYFQIYNEQQREGANAAAMRLRSLGIGVPGIENVLSGRSGSDIDRFRRSAPRDLLEVRYFRATDAEVANALGQVLTQQTSKQVRTRLVNLRGTPVRSGQLEVWYPWQDPSGSELMAAPQ